MSPRLAMLCLCLSLWAPPVLAEENAPDHDAILILDWQDMNDRDAVDTVAAHLDALQAGGYRIVSLQQAIDSLENKGESSSEPVAVLTFDAPSRAFLSGLLPLLEERGLPATLFLTPDSDSDEEDPLPSLPGGVEIGLRPDPSTSLVTAPADIVAGTLRTSLTALREETGLPIRWFAYPNGESGGFVKESVARAGFKGAVGEQAGFALPGSDPFALPRFVITGSTEEADQRLQRALSALPFPVQDLIPAQPLLTENPPVIGFTVPEGLGPGPIPSACFASEDVKILFETVGPSRVELRFARPLTPGRLDITCVAPLMDSDSVRRIRTLGMTFTVPERS